MIDLSYYDKIGFVLFLPLFFLFLMTRIDLVKAKKMFGVFFSNSYFYDYSTDTELTFSVFHVLKLGFVSSLLSLLSMLVFYDQHYIFYFFFTIYARCFGMSVLYLLVKYTIVEFLYLVSKKKHLKQVLLLEISYLTAIFFLSYLVVCYAFLHLNQLDIVLKIIGISFLITYLIRFIAMLINNKNLLSGKFLYIILYLCCLEILPCIYLFKRYIL